jgi:hypothetical protein
MIYDCHVAVRIIFFVFKRRGGLKYKFYESYMAAVTLRWDSMSFTFHCIPQMLSTKDTQCVEKSGGIFPVSFWYNLPLAQVPPEVGTARGPGTQISRRLDPGSLPPGQEGRNGLVGIPSVTMIALGEPHIRLPLS